MLARKHGEHRAIADRDEQDVPAFTFDEHLGEVATS